MAKAGEVWLAKTKLAEGESGSAGVSPPSRLRRFGVTDFANEDDSLAWLVDLDG